MRKKFLLVITILSIVLTLSFSFPDIVRAQDRNGDYFISNFPTSDGTHFDNRWKVMSSLLNCRLRAGTENMVLTQFPKDEILFVPVAFMRTSNVDPIYLDARGKPWMIVIGSGSNSSGRGRFDRGRFGNDGVCFVRANQSFVNPT